MMNNSNDVNKLDNKPDIKNPIPNEFLSIQDNIHISNFMRTIKMFSEVNSLPEEMDFVNRLGLDILSEIRSSLDETLNIILQNANDLLSDVFLADNHLKEVLKRTEHQYSHSGEVRKAYRNSGWPIAPSMPVAFNRYVVELDRKGKAKQAWRKILGYYHRDNFWSLKAMVESWEEVPAFQPRMPIIYDALDAHCQGKYTLSIPALLPQIEGLLSEFAIKHGIHINFGRPNGISKKVLETQDITVISQAMSSMMVELCNQLYQYDEFKRELTKKPKNRKVTRNTILHGISTNYATPCFSLKLFLSLDYLSGLENIKILPTEDE